MNKNNILKGILKSSFAITSVLILIKLISFVRDMLLANKFGATVFSDVFYASNSVLLLFTSFVRSPFSASYLPIATEYYYKKDLKEQKQFFGTVYGAAICIGIFFCVVEFLFIDIIIQLIVPGFTLEAKEILKIIITIQLPVILLSFILAVNTSNLKLIDKFAVSEISEAFAPGLCVIYMIVNINKKVSINELAICIVVGYLIATIFQYITLYKNGITPHINFHFKQCKGLKMIMCAMVPFMMAAAARELNAIIDKIIGSKLSVGSITILSYASKMTVTEVGLIATAISVVIFSQMSKLNAKSDKEGLGDTLAYGIKFVNTLLIPMSIGTIVLSPNIIQVLFGRGEFETETVLITAKVMSIYAIGMLGAGMEDVLMRGMHATKHRKFPAAMSVVMVCINIVLNLVLYRPMGIYGLALATSISTLVIILPLYMYLDKTIVRITGKYGLLKNTFGVFLSAIIMGGVVLLVKRVIVGIISNEILVLSVLTIIGIIIYSCMMVITKNDIFYVLILKKDVKK